jgi:hypothetical protein
MSSPAPTPEFLRELAKSVLVAISWPSNLGRPGFAATDEVPVGPKLEDLFTVKLHWIEMVKGRQEPGQPIAYVPLPVPLSDQKAHEYRAPTSNDGATSCTMIASGNWGTENTILVTVALKEGRIWVRGPALGPTERVEFWAVPGQHWATPTQANPLYGQISLERGQVPMGRVAFQAERR